MVLVFGQGAESLSWDFLGFTPPSLTLMDVGHPRGNVSGVPLSWDPSVTEGWWTHIHLFCVVLYGPNSML